MEDGVVGDVLVRGPGRLTVIRHRVPAPSTNRMQMGIGLTKVYNSSDRVCHKRGPFTGCPHIVNRRFFNIVSTINRNIRDTEINRHITISPIIDYKRYCPYSVNGPGIYAALTMLNIRTSNNFDRCTIIPTGGT